jgi:hypothetical protein
MGTENDRQRFILPKFITALNGDNQPRLTIHIEAKRLTALEKPTGAFFVVLQFSKYL